MHAEASFEVAALSGEAGRHDEVVARARSRLALLIGYDKADYDRASALAPQAAAAIERLGGNPDIEVILEGSSSCRLSHAGGAAAVTIDAVAVVAVLERVELAVAAASELTCGLRRVEACASASGPSAAR